MAQGSKGLVASLLPLRIGTADGGAVDGSGWSGNTQRSSARTWTPWAAKRSLIRFTVPTLGCCSPSRILRRLRSSRLGPVGVLDRDASASLCSDQPRLIRWRSSAAQLNRFPSDIAASQVSG